MNKSSIMNKLAVSMACAAVLASGAVSAGPILAGTSYVYHLSTTSKLPSGSTLATVKLTQASATQVDVRMTLADNYYFAATGGSNSPTFAFSLFEAYKQATVSYSGSDFSVMPLGSYNLSPDGRFTNGLRLTTPGTSGKVGAPLDFSVSLQSGISLDAFALSTKKNDGQPGGYAFAAHIGHQSGETGSIGFVGLTPTKTVEPDEGSNEIPEPASVALMGLGLAGLALRKRRRA